MDIRKVKKLIEMLENSNLEEIEIQEGQTTDNQKEELEDYSQSVKRRIDKLTRKMREAERREQAAIDYATKVNDKYKQALTLGTQKDDANVASRENAVTAREEFAKRAFEAAVSAQDVEKQVGRPDPHMRELGHAGELLGNGRETLKS